MILGKQSLRAAIADGRIRLHDDHGATLPEWEPLLRGEVGAQDPIALQPASIDLHFGNEWLVPRVNGDDVFDCDSSEFLPTTDAMLPVEYDTTVSDSFLIPSHGFVLVRTREVIGIADTLFAKVEGRSSVGRLGLIVETAGLIDAGFYGTISLELVNCLPNPLRVYAGMRGCQIWLSEIQGSTEGGYAASGKYQNQIATTGTRIAQDFASK